MQPLASYYNFQALKAIELVRDSVSLSETPGVVKNKSHNAIEVPNSRRDSTQRRRLSGLRRLFAQLENEMETYPDLSEPTQSTTS